MQCSCLLYVSVSTELDGLKRQQANEKEVAAYDSPLCMIHWLTSFPVSFVNFFARERV